MQALKMIREIPHSCSYNYLIADKDGAWAVETSPPKMTVRKAEDGFLVVVNHYMAGEMKAEQKKLLPNSVARQRLAETESAGIKSFAAFKNFLAGHADRGVCQHDYENYFGTLWSCIFDLHEIKAYYAFGSPCLNEYQTFDLKNENKLNTTITCALAKSGGSK